MSIRAKITFEYELILHRLSRHPESRAALAAATHRSREIVARLRQSFDRALTLLDRGIADPRNDLSDRLTMARMRGALNYLQRQVGPFIELGERIRAAYTAGRVAEAQALLAGFAKFEEAFGPDLAAVRKDLAALTLASTTESTGRLERTLWIGAGLFAFASLAGLGLSGVFSTRMHRAVHRLLDGTQALEGGQFTVTVHIQSRDEIGQLAKAFNRMVGELRTKEQIKETFGRYVDPRIVARLIEASSENPNSAERRSVTVLFSDIKGFTAMSERLTAAAMVNLLNRYFTEVTAAIRAHQGIIDKYMGDAVMAFWTPPFSPGDRHAADACLSAFAQQEAIAPVQKDLPEILGLRRDVPALSIRMGLASGEVVVGTVGSPTAKSYTVIGDPVNLASRLEGANKIYGTTILLAEDTYRLAHNAIEMRELDLVVVVGKTEPARIYEALAPIGQLSQAQIELRGLFSEGLDAYRRHDWDLAERGFRECVRVREDDGPARLFLERVALLRLNPPPSDWDGVWRLTRK